MNCVWGESMREAFGSRLSWFTTVTRAAGALVLGLAVAAGVGAPGPASQMARADTAPGALPRPHIDQHAVAALAAMAIPADAPPGTVQRRLGGEIASTPLSPECASKSPAHEGARAFRRIYQAMQERRSARVLAIGSSSIVGVGASQPAATFTVQLEADLESAFKGADFDIIARGVSGEAAEGTAARIRAEAVSLKPDLIVWQVGTNDGVAHVDQAVFAALLTSTLRWLSSQRLDVVLIDPQYVGKFASDDHYTGIVRTVADVARRERVPLVHRYKAMQDLARTQINRSYMASDLFHLNDLGYKCMAEFAAQAIETGVRQAVAEGTLERR
jgi:acyl-CoA thioesterase I